MIETTLRILGEDLRYKWISIIDIDDKRRSDWDHCEICSCCGTKIVHVVYRNGVAHGMDCIEKEINKNSKIFINLKKQAKKRIKEETSEQLKIEINNLDNILSIIGRHKSNIELYKKLNLKEEIIKSEEFLAKYMTKEIELRKYIRKVYGYSV